ncbi:DNA polymerase II large subunit [Candidatus Woesearchaeota archaeon]|nr:DNA polymerase II large subunit [Candidatus Woesearchaeota archaeon]
MTELNIPLEIKQYFEKIEKQVEQANQVAKKARQKGYDPETEPGIPIARNMAERVIGLISAVAPQVKNTKIPQRIQELEKKYGVLDWRISLIIAEEIANEKFCKFKDKKQAIEIGIRVGFAYHTLGTVASPLEGLTEIKIEKRNDGKDYFSLQYSGPIRSAGGTGASVSVLIADYVRRKMGFDVYDPTEEEINRITTELYDYHERVTNLQYLPSKEEIRFLVKHLPVQIAGDPSEKIEVSQYKDLKRIPTNYIRNGPCLVIGECLAQKAPKLWKQLSKWGKDFNLEHWSFLEEFLKIQKKKKAAGEEKEEEKPKITPDYTYIKDLVAGRPILTHPLRTGGFRLRYGRARTSGYSAGAIHPATMFILNKYIAIGTQLKVERPGKATVVSSCDSIEGPIIKLIDGSVIKIDTIQKAKEHVENIQEILFLGDILFNYGDFLNRAHPLVPPGYCQEWWIQEFEKATVNLFGNLDIDKLSEFTEIPSADINTLLKNPLKSKITAEAAILFSKKLKIPLHPDYTYHWKTISYEQFQKLISCLDKANIKRQDSKLLKIIMPLEEESKRILEQIGIPHIVVANEYAVIEKQDAQILAENLSINDNNLEKIKSMLPSFKDKNPLEIINQTSAIKLKDKSGIFIGARMGRPEKAKQRKLTGSPHVLFPVGTEGGRLRSFQEALEVGKINADFAVYYCEHCKKETILAICPACDKKTKRKYRCGVCGLIDKKECPKHGKADLYTNKDINIKEYFSQFLKKLKTRTYPDLIKGVRGTSNKEHIPEHLIKGILRAKHSIYVNKDGTTRFDMTQMPLTHFKPKEIDTSIEKLKQLGYTKDIRNKSLENPDQVLELKPQDIILPVCAESPDEGADKVMFRVAQFIDDLLVNLYGLEPFYNLKTPKDLIGHLALALAPHTSAAITTRIIGFSQTQGFLAHPMIHAATRRDCDGDEASIFLLLDGLINFSKKYLPAHRGSTQDAPFVMTTSVKPSEVDDMIFDLDTPWKYPLEFYQACLEYKKPWEVDLPTYQSRVNTEKQYSGLGFTHDTANFNNGVRCSLYKTLPSMEEKLKGQMDLAEKIRAVDTSDVARLVIERHFLRDIKGNLRKFSMQEFRCVKCNAKYRRPPLVGKCIAPGCTGRIIFTISEGSVIKYLEPSMSIANKYDVPPYLKQSLELIQRRIEAVFGKDKEKQEGLGKWFG